MIKIVCRLADGTRHDISKLLTKVVWSGDIKSCSRKLEFSTIASSSDNKIKSFNIPLSAFIIFYENDKELFRGFIYKRDLNSSSSTIEYLAYEYAQKLNDIKCSYNIKDKTPSQIVDMICKEYSIKKNKIASSSVKVKKIFLGATLYETIMSAYTEQSKSDNKKYMIEYIGDTLNVVEKGIIKLKTTFEESKNIINSSFSETVEGMVNKVLIVDDTGSIKSDIKDEGLIKVHGLFQDVYQASEGKDDNVEAKKLLKGITQTCKLSGFGDTTCKTGYGVQVKDSFTNLVGHFYIDSDIHTWEGGKYSIDLDLNFKNIMHEVEAGKDETETSSSSNGVTVSGGKEVDAEFTAYYPSNDPMQGGFKSANGETLKPQNLTCAAPKEVSFGTKIQVKGTGTSRDGVVYRVNDRGGAIKIVNGVYKIDLLMSTRQEAYSFGRRKGKAVIGVSTTSNSNDSSSSSKANKAVDIAKTKIGGPYVWGATGPNKFDCSGLTQFCYKQVGVSIPRTSREQANFGKKVDKNNLQAGDLVFFDTKGSGVVTHVGIYEGNGVFIHASSPKNGIKRNKVNESYYVKAWKGARRVV